MFSVTNLRLWGGPVKKQWVEKEALGCSGQDAEVIVFHWAQANESCLRALQVRLALLTQPSSISSTWANPVKKHAMNFMIQADPAKK